MFDANFYTTVLPGLVKAECAAGTADVPVVEVRLADGTTLDVCHIIFLGPDWLAFACYPSRGPSARLATEFVRYDLVTRLTVSVQESQTRKMGFDLVRNSAAMRIGVQPPGEHDVQ